MAFGMIDRRGFESKVIIYYGSQNGYSPNNRLALSCPGRSNSVIIADYNKDNWLDIAAGSLTIGVKVFYGSPDGFDENRNAIMDIPGVAAVESADFNKDGWLDLVACSYADSATQFHDLGVSLLWGSPDGFKTWNAQWLLGFTTHGPLAADFDSDGFLDIFLPNYHGQLTREYLPSFLYWGRAEWF